MSKRAASNVIDITSRLPAAAAPDNNADEYMTEEAFLASGHDPLSDDEIADADSLISCIGFAPDGPWRRIVASELRCFENSLYARGWTPEIPHQEGRRAALQVIARGPQEAANLFFLMAPGSIIPDDDPVRSAVKTFRAEIGFEYPDVAGMTPEWAALTITDALARVVKAARRAGARLPKRDRGRIVDDHYLEFLVHAIVSLVRLWGEDEPDPVPMARYVAAVLLALSIVRRRLMTTADLFDLAPPYQKGLRYLARRLDLMTKAAIRDRIRRTLDSRPSVRLKAAARK